MRSPIFAVVALIAVACACQQTSEQNPQRGPENEPGETGTPDDYGVYRAALAEGFLLAGQRQILISDTAEPWTGAGWCPAQEYLALDLGPLLAQLASAEPLQLENRFGLDLEVIFLDEAQRAAALECSEPVEFDEFGECLRANYPEADGIVTLSRIAYDERQTKAVVYAANHCGSLCGNGAFYALEMDEGSWHVIARLCNWVA
jgi:hypothetical protein